MNDELETQAELLKLARLLGTDPEKLAYLEQISPDELRAVREQATEMLFTAHETAFKRLAAASKLLPVGLVASLGQHTFGAILSARITGLLEPARAVEIAAKLPTEFLADIAVELDPRRATEVIAGIPPERIFEVTSELARRGEHVTMGRFVGHLSDDALARALEALTDEDLIQTVFVIEGPLRVDRFVRLLGPARIERIVALADEDGLWPELRELVARSSDPA